MKKFIKAQMQYSVDQSYVEIDFITKYIFRIRYLWTEKEIYAFWQLLFNLDEIYGGSTYIQF